MGNQNSGDGQSNKYLDEKSLQIIKQPFKNGSIKRLPSSWGILDSAARTNIEKYLTSQDGTINFQKYQNLAGNSLKGTLEDKIRFLSILMGDKPGYTVQDIWTALQSVFSALQTCLGDTGRQEESLVNSLLHDTLFPGEKRKNAAGKTYDKNKEIDLGTVENILVHNLLVEQTLAVVLSKCFMLESPNTQLGVPFKDSFLPCLSLLFLNYSIPHQLKDNWRFLFSTRSDGESFSKLAGAIMNRGPTLVIIKDNEGNIFGGYGSHSWRLGPNFFGSSECFLFQLHPSMNVYDATPFNQNFQYFNLKQKTMPNGLGQGGQLEYFGYWVDSEFGIVRTSPSCSTFHSPQLGVQEGRIVDMEVWGVGPELESDGAGSSVLSLDPELQAVMEMMGKTFHSKAIREVDAREEEDKQRDVQFQEEPNKPT